MPSIKDLRKELRELRSHYPVSKMRKNEVVAELEKLRGPVPIAQAKPEVTVPHKRRVPAETFDFESDSEDEFAFVPQVQAAAVKPKAVKAVPVKAPVRAKAIAKPEPMPVAKPRPAAAQAPAKPAKLVKGSQEAREHMARLRELRKARA